MGRSHPLPSLLLLILLSPAPIVLAESHSHLFFSTATNNDTHYPLYYTTRAIDDVTLYWYDSDSEVVDRRVPWYKSDYITFLDASLHQYQLQTSMQRLFRFFSSHMNETGGFHYAQKMEGCITYDNGTVKIVFSYHYDAKPFLIFNTAKVKWIAEVPAVQYFADYMNLNQSQLDEHYNDLIKSCARHIPYLLSLGSCTFNRTEKPIVKVTKSAILNSSCTLHCRAYGHYPKKISMTWYKNEEPVPESLVRRVTLPYPDITYLTWLSVSVTPNNDDVYRCSVTHSSMMAPFSEELSLSEEAGEHPAGDISIGGILAICLGLILLVVLTVFVVVSVAKSRRR